jgi:hypothetical protein
MLFCGFIYRLSINASISNRQQIELPQYVRYGPLN